MLTIPLDGLIATAHIFQGLKLQIIYWATLLELPVVIVKNKSLAVYLIGYVFWSILTPNTFFLKQPIKVKINIDSAFCFDDW